MVLVIHVCTLLRCSSHIWPLSNTVSSAYINIPGWIEHLKLSTNKMEGIKILMGEGRKTSLSERGGAWLSRMFFRWVEMKEEEEEEEEEKEEEEEEEEVEKVKRFWEGGKRTTSHCCINSINMMQSMQQLQNNDDGDLLLLAPNFAATPCSRCACVLDEELCIADVGRSQCSSYYSSWSLRLYQARFKLQGAVLNWFDRVLWLSLFWMINVVDSSFLYHCLGMCYFKFLIT